jgi:hypothetical protein
MCVCIFYGDGVVSPTPQPPTWKTRVFLCLKTRLELEGMVGPTNIYAATGVAFTLLVTPMNSARKGRKLAVVLYTNGLFSKNKRESHWK